MADDMPPDWELAPTFAWGRELFRASMLGLAVVAVLLTYQRFDPTFELIDDDAVASWQPIFTDFANQLQEGRLPVWSDHTSCGFPLLGWPQPSFVYPPMWVAHGVCRVLRFESGEFYVATLMHAFLAAAAAFVYLRHLDVHPLAAATAAFATPLSGILLGLGSCWPTYLFTAAYWPLVFLAIEEIRRRPTWFWTLALGWLGGMAFLYADLLLMIKFTMLGGLYFALRLDRGSAGRMVRSALIAWTIALVVGIGQWLPSGELIRSSARMGLGSNDFYTAPPILWLGYVFPFRMLPWEPFDFSRARAAGGFFVGPCALLGLLFAVRWFGRLRGPHRTLVLLVPLYVGLALGSLWAPNELLQQAPVFSAIRWPFRWLFEASAVLALLSGFGLHLAFRDLSIGKGRTIVRTFVVGVGFVLLLRWPSPPGMSLLTAAMTLTWVVGLAGLWLWSTPGHSQRFLIVVAAWTVIAMIANVPVAQTTRMARMTHLVDQPLDVGKESLDRVLFLARHSDLVSAQKEGNLARLFPHRFGTRSVLGYVYRPPTQAWMTGFELDGLIYEDEAGLARRWLGPESTLLSGLRVGHVVVFKANKVLAEACAADPHLKLESESEFYRIYRHTGFKSAAFLVESVKRQESPADLVDLGLRVRLPKEALVAKDYQGPTTYSGIGAVTEFREHHGRIAMTVDSPDAGFLVVTTTYFSRWRATIDGEPTPIVPANGSFLGIRVPPGRHEVALTYWPADQVALLAISGVAWLLVTIACVVCLRRREAQDERC